MAKAKKSISHSGYVVVPNASWNAGKKRNSKKRATTRYWSELIEDVAKKTRKSRDYSYIKAHNNTYLVVRDKATGRIISKSSIGKKKGPVRKFVLGARAGSISTKKILDAIRRY